GHIPAVAAAHQSDAGAIDVVRRLEKTSCFDHVAKVTASHVEAVLLFEIFAIAGGSAIIRRNHNVAVVYQVLHAPVETVYVLRGRSAMDVDDRRVAAILLEIVGNVEERRNLEIVP